MISRNSSVRVLRTWFSWTLKFSMDGAHMEGYPWLGHPQTCLGMMFPIPQKQEMVIQTELAVTVGAQKKQQRPQRLRQISTTRAFIPSLLLGELQDQVGPTEALSNATSQHQQNFPSPFCTVQLNGPIDIFCDIRPMISAITACHHHCKFTQPETILNLNCILKNYYPPPLCKLAIWFICGNHFKKYTFRNTYTTWCLFHMASHNYFAVCEHDENSFIIL